MPLPLVLGVAAGIAGAVGTGAAVHGAVKMKQANDSMKNTEERHNRNLERLKENNDKTTKQMDKLGKEELEILDSFKTFSDYIEKVQNRPEFKNYNMEKIEIPEYDPEELKKVSLGASILLGGLSGAAMGTAGGFAAAGATTSAVMAVGVASTGTSIASLTGIAATNATLAALGGGAIAAGGGGIALGTTILGVTTLGVGLLVGGLIFNFSGESMHSKADKAYEQMQKTEKDINEICSYLKKLYITSSMYNRVLSSANEIYKKHLAKMEIIVDIREKTDWNTFTEEEKLCFENAALLVSLLYKMCRVSLVIQTEGERLNEVNAQEAEKTLHEVEDILKQKGFNNAMA
ncbi:MAG: hypothetical protein IJN64_17795 [Lachnospiraceae bacterium]|nr:hypothetical protein [Lachnospiraceae bacterium]